MSLLTCSTKLFCLSLSWFEFLCKLLNKNDHQHWRSHCVLWLIIKTVVKMCLLFYIFVIFSPHNEHMSWLTRRTEYHMDLNASQPHTVLFFFVFSTRPHVEQACFFPGKTGSPRSAARCLTCIRGETPRRVAGTNYAMTTSLRHSANQRRRTGSVNTGAHG